MKPILLLPLLLAVPALADESPAPAPSFLSSRGVISSDELLGDLNFSLSPEKRAQFDKAVARRNSALQLANEELNMALRDLLQTDDAGLQKRADEEQEARRLERMKRLQPSRYQELMNRKKKQEQKKP